MIATEDIPIYLFRIISIILVFSFASLFTFTQTHNIVLEYTTEKNRLALLESPEAKLSHVSTFSFTSIASAVEIDQEYKIQIIAEKAAAEIKPVVRAKQVVKKVDGKNGVYKITGYQAVAAQTDDSPTIAAWNDNIENAINVAAVTQDSPWKRGTCLEISGLPEKYLVLDRFNARYNGQKKVDILVGTRAEAHAITGNKTVTVSPPGSCDLKRMVNGEIQYEPLQKKRF